MKTVIVRTSEKFLATPLHLNEIENETHFLFNCHHYSDTRKKFFNEINDIYPNVNNADPFVCRTVAAYIYDSMLKRQLMMLI